MTRRRFVLGGSAHPRRSSRFLYFVLPQIAGLDETWHRIEQGDPWWLALAAGVRASCPSAATSCCSGTSSSAAARGSACARATRSRWPALAATRLFAAGGAGGIALTAWAMRRAGMSRARGRRPDVAFLVLTYVVYMVAHARRRARPAHRASSRAGAVRRSRSCRPCSPGSAIVITLLIALLPTDLQRRLERRDRPRRVARAPARRRRRRSRRRCRPACAIAIDHVRARDPASSGSIGYWGFNIAMLWASFHAFGDAPPWAVIVMGFFVGMLGNLLPLPGGVGGVDGGMIGAFIGVRRRRRPGGRRGADLPRVRVLAADDPGRDRVLPAAAYRRALAGRAGRRAGAGAAAVAQA